jgi:hypothetical protein
VLEYSNGTDSFEGPKDQALTVCYRHNGHRFFLIVLGYGEYERRGCSSGEIGSIKLACDPSLDPDVAGYKVYYGTSPGDETRIRLQSISGISIR